MLAAIPNLFGNGHDAEMSYYELPSGVKVFAAGAFTLAEAVWLSDVQRAIENPWKRLANDRVTSGPIGNVASPR